MTVQTDLLISLCLTDAKLDFVKLEKKYFHLTSLTSIEIKAELDSTLLESAQC